MSNTKTGPSGLSIVYEDGTRQKVGEVPTVEPDELCFADNGDDIIQRLRCDEEASFKIQLPDDVIDRILQTVLGITRMVLAIVQGQGNRRVAHLAKHARKARTRKKNIRRAYRILVKEATK